MNNAHTSQTSNHEQVKALAARMEACRIARRAAWRTYLDGQDEYGVAAPGRLDAALAARHAHVRAMEAFYACKPVW